MHVAPFRPGGRLRQVSHGTDLQANPYASIVRCNASKARSPPTSLSNQASKGSRHSPLAVAEATCCRAGQSACACQKAVRARTLHGPPQHPSCTYRQGKSMCRDPRSSRGTQHPPQHTLLMASEAACAMAAALPQQALAIACMRSAWPRLTQQLESTGSMTHIACPVAACTSSPAPCDKGCSCQPTSADAFATASATAVAAHRKRHGRAS